MPESEDIAHGNRRRPVRNQLYGRDLESGTRRVRQLLAIGGSENEYETEASLLQRSYHHAEWACSGIATKDAIQSGLRLKTGPFRDATSTADDLRKTKVSLDWGGRVVVTPMNITVRLAQAADFDQIVSAYYAWGYGGGIKPEDTTWLALIEGELVGVVRIAPENGTLVLRGMRIAESQRRQGLGSRMLCDIARWLENRECYCIPYAHLVEFYGQIGFLEIAPHAAPPFLVDRAADYEKRGLDVAIMCRRP